MIRLLHSADLHLGKPFGRYPEEVRGRLRLARAGVVAQLARAARDNGAAVIVLAGDTFDAETPSPPVMRQALNAIKADAALRWIILPGNHDSLAASQLWRTLAADAPGNVTLATGTAPLPLGQDAVLLTAPCTTRRPGRDLTETLDQPTAPGLIRIGLAHGAVTDFAGGISEEGEPAIIPPDRAERSGLDYLALGDWHGQMRIGPRQWYAGTPETDSFKHAMPGSALIVEVTGPGATPVVTSVRTGALHWLAPTMDLTEGEDGAARLGQTLPDLAARVDCLLQLRFTGRLSLAGQAALAGAVAAIAPDFLHCAADWTGLATAHDSADLDLIDRAGALRTAADRLVAEAADPALSAADRATAGAALSRLFAFATEAP